MGQSSEVRERLQRAIVRLEEHRDAIVRLEEHRDEYKYVKHNPEYIRLNGKIEGVKLALAYLEGH